MFVADTDDPIGRRAPWCQPCRFGLPWYLERPALERNWSLQWRRDALNWSVS